jgi:putative inorganic carbon (HCO3(-)) transporter
VIGQAERWVLRAGVFLLPLAHTWDTYDGYILPKLLLARALVVTLALLLLLRLAAGGRLTIRRTPLDWPLLAFVASTALSSAFAFNQNVALFGTYARYDALLTTLTYAALFWLAVQVIDSRDEARTVLRVLMASAYAAALLAIAQVAHDSLTSGTFVPAYGTLGQKNVLGGFLVMILPVAAFELIDSRSKAATVLAANVCVAVATALVLTFSRSAWIAAAVAALIVAVWIAGSDRARIAGIRLGATALITGAVTLLLLVSLIYAGGFSSLRGDLASPGDRPTVWADSIKLIESRPLLGYGPDNFGLVFPEFQSKRLQQPFDKAHAEVLQIAATQGVIGVAAYGAMLLAFALAFWRGRTNTAAAALFAGWVAYQAALQVNFTALASAFPYWVFAACAFELWGATRSSHVVAIEHRMRFAPVLAIGAAAGVVVVAIGVVSPYLADRALLSAVIADYAGRGYSAVPAAGTAMTLNPQESVYAVEVGNLAFERGDWHTAAAAYKEAADLGTYNPMVYRNLSLADRQLGRLDDARAAARAAYELDRFDPANRALLEQYIGPVV